MGTNSFHLLRQYWSTSSNDLNSETRNRCNKSFTSFALKKESLIYEAPLFHMYEYLYVFDNKVGYRYNAVHCNMISHTPLQWLKQNTNQTINSQLRYSISRPYEGIIGRLLWGYGRKLPALGANFLASNAASNTTMVLYENNHITQSKCHAISISMLILLHEILDIYFGFVVIKCKFLYFAKFWNATRLETRRYGCCFGEFVARSTGYGGGSDSALG